MAFIKNHEFIVQNKDNTIYNFYLNEKKFIECISTNKKQQWDRKQVIFSKATDLLTIDIDNEGNIHIISYHPTGELYYHFFNSERLSHHLINSYDSKNHRIFYPTIKYVEEQLHLFYYLVNTRKKSKAQLMHIFWKEENHQKKPNHIYTLSWNKYINPFRILVNKGQLYLIFTSLINQYEQLFFISYDVIENMWSKPVQFTFSTDNKIYLDALLDPQNQFHCIWSSYDQEYLTVQHLRASLENLNDSNTLSSSSTLSAHSSSSFPIIIFYQKALWIIWTEMNQLFSSHSLDLGETWSPPSLQEKSRKVDFKRYRYVSNLSYDNSLVQCEFLYGTLYPNIEFIGFGGEIYDEVPQRQ